MTLVGQEWESEFPHVLERVASWEVYKDEMEEKVNMMIEEQKHFKFQIKSLNKESEEVRTLVNELPGRLNEDFDKENKEFQKKNEEKMNQIGKFSPYIFNLERKFVKESNL